MLVYEKLKFTKQIKNPRKVFHQKNEPPKESESRFINGINQGINLDQNCFSELFFLDGRFWDSNSNTNVNANGETKNSKKSKNLSNLGPSNFLKLLLNQILNQINNYNREKIEMMLSMTRKKTGEMWHFVVQTISFGHRPNH